MKQIARTHQLVDAEFFSVEGLAELDASSKPRTTLDTLCNYYFYLKAMPDKGLAFL